MKKICESCGMPMEKPEDFGGKNPDNRYCVYCTDSKGNLKSYKEKVKDMTGFIMRTTDLSEEQAMIMAKENLKKFPAWANINE